MEEDKLTPSDLLLLQTAEKEVEFAKLYRNKIYQHIGRVYGLIANADILDLVNGSITRGMQSQNANNENQASGTGESSTESVTSDANGSGAN